MKKLFIRAAALTSAFVFSTALSAHYSWIMPSKKDCRIEIGHGHNFPISEQAMNKERIRATLFDGSGHSIPGIISKESDCLSVAPSTSLKEIAAALFIEEPLILNRTTKGVKTGPMSGCTGVIDSFRRHRCGFFQSAANRSFESVPDQLTIRCKKDEKGWYLSCRFGDKTLSGLEIEVIEPLSKEGRKLGVTDAEGRLAFRGEKSGPHLFTARWSQPCSGTDTLRDEYISTLVLTIE